MKTLKIEFYDVITNKLYYLANFSQTVKSIKKDFLQTTVQLQELVLTLSLRSHLPCTGGTSVPYQKGFGSAYRVHCVGRDLSS